MEHSPVGSPVSKQKGEIELKTVVINEVKIQLPEDKLADLIPIVSEETSKKENELKEQKERESETIRENQTRPYGLHASFLPLAGLPLTVPLPEKLKKRKGSSGSVERTYQSSAPEGCTYQSSAPGGCTYQSSAPEGCTYQSSAPEGCTHQSSAPEGCTYQSSAPEGCTYQSSAPEGYTYQSSALEGCTYP
ncbi:NBS-LRR type resistance protein [Cucumis melo var. makuwa]|uniref:NBS-LRR type resistance protein n=1 Tax=Cucumis melo var. makuwa TaxID=1194695 RepID=A0A5A7TCD3_CUCMM|nr:NBS-LRR type resistance protein [Cucumis melo var. makuwa]